MNGLANAINLTQNNAGLILVLLRSKSREMGNRFKKGGGLNCKGS